MGTITLESVRIYAFHGCLSEEAKIGSDYEIDLTVKCNLAISAATDELTDTVDYVDLYSIVAEEMSIRSKLLEHVAQRIINQIAIKLPLVNGVKIKLAKINPPIGGDVKKVSVTIEEKFL